MYGTINVYTATAEFVLDASTPWTYTGKNVTETLYRQLFYNSSALGDGEHTLLITIIDGWFWVDYFTYTSSVSSSTSSTPNPPPTSNATGLPQPSSDGKSSVPVPVIAGVTIGVSALIVLIIGLWCIRKRLGDLSKNKGVHCKITVQVLPMSQAQTSCVPCRFRWWEFQSRHAPPRSHTPAVKSRSTESVNAHIHPRCAVRKRTPSYCCWWGGPRGSTIRGCSARECEVDRSLEPPEESSTTPKFHREHRIRSSTGLTDSQWTLLATPGSFTSPPQTQAQATPYRTGINQSTSALYTGS